MPTNYSKCAYSKLYPTSQICSSYAAQSVTSIHVMVQLQTLDARHFELFMNESYQDGSWDYTQIGSHETRKHVDGASGAIFDMKHLKDASSGEIFNSKSSIGKQNDWQPKAKLTFHAVAVNMNLQQNDGINVKFHVMRAGTDDQIMPIRES